MGYFLSTHRPLGKGRGADRVVHRSTLTKKGRFFGEEKKEVKAKKSQPNLHTRINATPDRPTPKRKRRK